jgi:hypothetical protein
MSSEEQKDEGVEVKTGHIECWINRVVKREVNPTTWWCRCYFVNAGQRVDRFWWADSDVDRDTEGADPVSQEYSKAATSQIVAEDDPKVQEFGKFEFTAEEGDLQLARLAYRVRSKPVPLTDASLLDIPNMSVVVGIYKSAGPPVKDGGPVATDVLLADFSISLQQLLLEKQVGGILRSTDGSLGVDARISVSDGILNYCLGGKVILSSCTARCAQSSAHSSHGTRTAHT